MKALRNSLAIGLLIFGLAPAMGQFKSSKYLIPTYTIKADTFSYMKPSLMTQKYNVQQQPFFCKMEELITRQAKFNFRFRLGSLDYVNKLEYGK